jgi:hypothetical protein
MAVGHVSTQGIPKEGHSKRRVQKGVQDPTQPHRFRSGAGPSVNVWVTAWVSALKKGSQVLVPHLEAHHRRGCTRHTEGAAALILLCDEVMGASGGGAPIKIQMYPQCTAAGQT